MGDQGTAGKRAKQLLDSLKLGGAKYKEQAVLSPDNVKTKMFINPDKPACQVRKEMLGKSLFEIWAKEKPDTTFTLQRSEATVWANKRPLCSVKILSEMEARISWMESRRIGLGIDLASIDTKIAQAVLERGEVWT